MRTEILLNNLGKDETFELVYVLKVYVRVEYFWNIYFLRWNT